MLISYHQKANERLGSAMGVMIFCYIELGSLALG